MAFDFGYLLYMVGSSMVWNQMEGLVVPIDPDCSSMFQEVAEVGVVVVVPIDCDYLGSSTVRDQEEVGAVVVASIDCDYLGSLAWDQDQVEEAEEGGPVVVVSIDCDCLLSVGPSMVQALTAAVVAVAVAVVVVVSNRLVAERFAFEPIIHSVPRVQRLLPTFTFSSYRLIIAAISFSLFACIPFSPRRLHRAI